MTLNTGYYLQVYTFVTLILCGLVQYFTGMQSVLWFRGLGVDVMAALEGRNGVGVAAVVEHQDVAGILFIPQVRPAGGCLVHHRGVVDDAGGAQHVGHRIGVLGVVIRVAVFRVDLLEVGDVVVVEGLEHPFCDHLGHHVIRRNHHIVVRRTGFQLGVHGLVAALVFYLKKDRANARAVMQARREFEDIRYSFAASRIENMMKSTDEIIPERTHFSIVMKYYLLGKKHFSQLKLF